MEVVEQTCHGLGPDHVWLSALSAGLRARGSPVRARAWVAGQVPSGRSHERQPHNHVSLPLLPPSFSLSKNKEMSL